MDSRLTLSDTDRFDEYRVESGSFAKDNRFACLACHASQRTGRWRRAYKGILLARQRLHTGLVAEDTAFRTLAARVDCQDCQFASFVNQVHTECIDRRTFTGSRHSGDTDADGLAGMRQAFLNDFLCNLLVFIFGAFHQCHSLAEDRYVSFQDSFHKLGRRIFFALNSSFQIRIDCRYVSYSLVYL